MHELRILCETIWNSGFIIGKYFVNIHNLYSSSIILI